MIARGTLAQGRSLPVELHATPAGAEVTVGVPCALWECEMAQCLRGSGPVPRSKIRFRLKARENK
ncbi:hypothetical protein HaLaN_32900, partial [Haematococcus lacustris]